MLEILHQYLTDQGHLTTGFYQSSTSNCGRCFYVNRPDKPNLTQIRLCITDTTIIAYWAGNRECHLHYIDLHHPNSIQQLEQILTPETISDTTNPNPGEKQ